MQDGKAPTLKPIFEEKINPETEKFVTDSNAMSKDHLDSYLQEFCWRYNRRAMQPWMFETLMRELVTKKPLTYKTLTREVF